MFFFQFTEKNIGVYQEESLSRRENRENDTPWFLNPRNQIQGIARAMTDTEPYLSCYISNPKFPVWQEARKTYRSDWHTKPFIFKGKTLTT